jgi:anaerobic nitric oxide reductase flavorubredoxin
MICPSRGVIWRSNPLHIAQQYLRWADSNQENQITLVYDTMWNGTRVLAESIAAGIKQADPSVTLKRYNLAKSDRNDVITETFRSRTLLVGSPTINRTIQKDIGTG